MLIHNRFINLFIIMLIFMIAVILYFPINSRINQKQIEKLVYEKTDIIKIHQITTAKIGRPYTLIYGKDKNNTNKIIWIDYINKQADPKIVYILNTDNGITKEKAVEIAKQHGIKQIGKIEITYIQPKNFFDNDTLLSDLPEGAYWWAEDGHSKVAIIDYLTGKIYFVNN